MLHSWYSLKKELRIALIKLGNTPQIEKIVTNNSKLSFGKKE
jgi:hypothetical protein